MRQAFRRYGKRSQYVPAQQSIGGFGCGLLLRIFDLPAHPATLHFPPRAFAAAVAPPTPHPPTPTHPGTCTQNPHMRSHDAKPRGCFIAGSCPNTSAQCACRTQPQLSAFTANRAATGIDPGTLAPEARIMPLDQVAIGDLSVKTNYSALCFVW